MQTQYLMREQLQQLLDVVSELGYTVIGPRVDQAAIVYGPIRSIAELPVGITDQQSPGHYRLISQHDDPEHANKLFDYVVGPHAWKKFLFPPVLPLLRSKKTSEGWQCVEIPDTTQKIACLGVRACELAAIGIQDRVFMEGEYCDPAYASRRSGLLLIAVNCTRAAATCFCTSMGTGPEVTQGYDLALTELPNGFTITAGSSIGKSILQRLAGRPATPSELEQAADLRQNAVLQISRHIDSDDVHDKLLARLEHPQWDDVAQRCLSCANCTLVCPTCFCHSVEEVNDLVDESVIRERHWDSCFNFDFSHMSGGAARPQIRSRYRQWLTHKLATWIDQFGTSGCVGCGRCITWCPVGIDLTQEVAIICEGDDA